MKGLNERLVVLEFEVLESAAHEVHRTLGEVGLETGDLGKTLEEGGRRRLELVHRLDVERLGSVGEDGGEGELHC